MLYVLVKEEEQIHVNLACGSNAMVTKGKSASAAAARDAAQQLAQAVSDGTNVAAPQADNTTAFQEGGQGGAAKRAISPAAGGDGADIGDKRRKVGEEHAGGDGGGAVGGVATGQKAAAGAVAGAAVAGALAASAGAAAGSAAAAPAGAGAAGGAGVTAEASQTALWSMGALAAPVATVAVDATLMSETPH